MPEQLKDADGDVWVREGDDRWYLSGEPIRTRAEIERVYGPVTSVGVDTDDVRSLLAEAFDDLAGRMRAFPPFSLAQSMPDAITSQVAGWVGSWAAETATGLRS